MAVNNRNGAHYATTGPGRLLTGKNLSRLSTRCRLTRDNDPCGPVAAIMIAPWLRSLIFAAMLS